MLFIIVKVIAIIVFLFMGIKTHFSKQGKVTNVINLLLFYIVLMLLLTIYEFIVPTLPMLFTMVTLSVVGELL